MIRSYTELNGSIFNHISNVCIYYLTKWNQARTNLRVQILDRVQMPVRPKGGSAGRVDSVSHKFAIVDDEPAQQLIYIK